ncbi:PEP-utilizing enzyme [Candidatus Thioglobus sp.]|nr:PEP-utilizing enzyme [Candidatus Thioglobus sp.]
MISSKLQTLENLRSKLRIFFIPNFLSVSAKKFISIDGIEHKNLKKSIKSKLIAIRSAAADEDTQSSSAAGEYDSVLNVASDDSQSITAAINVVISSYRKKRPILTDDRVIIQEMVKNTSMSGVIFTHDLNTGAPYYVINYDDQSGLTDTVTSGEGKYSNRTLYIHRNSTDRLHSERFKSLLQAIQELESIMESNFLDIEFALGEDLTPYLLQVRAITTQPNWNSRVATRIDTTLSEVEMLVADRFKKCSNSYGKTTVLGQMPDWNPVEMIGRAPRALALSLYQALITDKVWQTARAIMGYMVPTDQPLMISLAGQPFIDTRLSFHSFLPSTISNNIAEKLVNHWIDRLKSSPELHDKIEFEIAITTYSFDIDYKIEMLIGDVLNDTEKDQFREAHRRQTKQLLLEGGGGSINNALNKINELKTKQVELTDETCFNNKMSILFTMIDDCIKLGTTPFSILARHGFIAKTLLLSLKHRGIITNAEVDKIQQSVQTVASELVDDMSAFQDGDMSSAKFMQIYGHLRPGTYDIRSPRYDQMKRLFSGTKSFQSNGYTEPFSFSQHQHQQVEALLIEEGFAEFNADNLLSYIRNAIIGREYGKFIFSKSISDILELIAKFSEKNGLSRDEVSHVPLDSLLNVIKNINKESIKEQLRAISEKEMDKHNISVAIRLPQLLVDQAGVYIVPFQVSHPNFITHKKITAPCEVLNTEINKVSLEGKVVIIEGADPGFDWIFSQKIVGLITKYGGVNSHMAIRCAEFGIPAAIGCGEQHYEQILKSNQVHLDCAAGLINPIH